MSTDEPVGGNEPLSPPTVAVIGGGPGAMFLCHALEMQKKELLASGGDVSGFPIVSCYERAPGPGGVWRSDRIHEETESAGSSYTDARPADILSFSEEKKEEDFENAQMRPEQKKMKVEGSVKNQSSGLCEISTKPVNQTPNMYSALWTNGPKEMFEFPDYTFVDHFGKVEMPTFLPRKFVLEYILGRCTKNCPNFFDKYFSFRTTVLNVQYIEGDGSDANTKKFRVHTRNENSGIEETKFFDKCIWAGGVNGIPNMPQKTVDLFRKGGFKGPIVHSSDTTNFKRDVDGKNVLIVGGGLSAEDLTLMAIKEGVSQIHCTFRSENKEMNHVEQWPYNKVKPYADTTVKKVEGNTVTLAHVYRDVYHQSYKIWKKKDEIILKNIDTVIFCTGYSPNLSMLDSSLSEAVDAKECDDDWYFAVPDDWRMKESKFLDATVGKDFGHVKPAKYLYKASDYFYSDYPKLYRGCISTENPNMMFFLLQFTDTPLIEIDIAAWMMVRYITGQRALPTQKEMREENYRVCVMAMDNISVRYNIDYKFHRALDRAIDWDAISEKTMELWWEEHFYGPLLMNYRLLGEIMNEHAYPVSHLCEDGKTPTEYNKKCRNIAMNDTTREFQSPKEGMTFRDAPLNDLFVSHFTGTRSCPLPKPWLELNEDDDDTLW